MRDCAQCNRPYDGSALCPVCGKLGSFRAPPPKASQTARKATSRWKPQDADPEQLHSFVRGTHTTWCGRLGLASAAKIPKKSDVTCIGCKARWNLYARLQKIMGISQAGHFPAKIQSNKEWIRHIFQPKTKSVSALCSPKLTLSGSVSIRTSPGDECDACVVELMSWYGANPGPTDPRPGKTEPGAGSYGSTGWIRGGATYYGERRGQ